MAWFITLLVAAVLIGVQYAIMPRPKQPKPAAAQDADNPVAEAGKPIGVVQGTITVTGLNVLWYGEKSINTYKVKA